MSIQQITEDIKTLKSLVQSMSLKLDAAPFRKEYYNLKQIAELTATSGVKAYTVGHLRILAEQGALEGARKADNGRDWIIPADTVEQVLNYGCKGKA